MKNGSEEVIRQKFRDLLYDLAKDQECLKDKSRRLDIYKRLESIYVPLPDGREFRHYYSDILRVLIDVSNDSKKGSIDILGQNLNLIRNGYDAKKAKKDISDKITKLFDHVNLEIVRLTYSESRYRDVSSETSISEMAARVSEIDNRIKQSEERIKQSEERIKQSENMNIQVQENVDLVKNKMDKATRDSIAIMGIFASIVLSFTAGFSFSSSVFSSINDASIYRIIVVVCTFGIIIASILYGLFYYIDRLTIRESEKTLKPLFVTYGVLIIIIVLTVVIWMFGGVEKRNAIIKDNIQRKNVLFEKDAVDASSGCSSVE